MFVDSTKALIRHFLETGPNDAEKYVSFLATHYRF